MKLAVGQKTVAKRKLWDLSQYICLSIYMWCKNWMNYVKKKNKKKNYLDWMFSWHVEILMDTLSHIVRE